MQKEELIRVFSAYLPYNVEFSDLTCDMPNKMTLDIENLSGVLEDAEHLKTIRLHLYDLSMLTKEIEHEGKIFIPTEYFEISDDHASYNIEFDFGNIKLIKNLELIAKHNGYFDIKFLPFEVVNKLIEWKFNIFNLPKDQYIDKSTLTPN